MTTGTIPQKPARKSEQLFAGFPHRNPNSHEFLKRRRPGEQSMHGGDVVILWPDGSRETAMQRVCRLEEEIRVLNAEIERMRQWIAESSPPPSSTD